MSDPLGPCNMFQARLFVDGRIVGQVRTIRIRGCGLMDAVSFLSLMIVRGRLLLSMLLVSTKGSKLSAFKKSHSPNGSPRFDDWGLQSFTSFEHLRKSHYAIRSTSFQRLETRWLVPVVQSVCLNHSDNLNGLDADCSKVSKDSESEKLRFPTFHRELMSQSYWNPGDHLGRIKLVISEGVFRDTCKSQSFRRSERLC